MELVIASLWSEISKGYQEQIVEAGREPLMFMLLAFLATFGITRFITHSIRTQRFTFLGDVHMGDTHVHHLVWGIILILITGFLAIALDPSPPKVILGIFFGIGAALTLDEFALWLHLEDVYWSEKGRASIDAVILTVVFLGLVFLVGFPVVIDTSDGLAQGLGVIAAQLPFWILAGITFAKGKLIMGVVGIFIPIVPIVTAIRLAKPNSLWAKKFYDEGKMARARARFKAEDKPEPHEDPIPEHLRTPHDDDKDAGGGSKGGGGKAESAEKAESKTATNA
jgi:hypothetical protein